MTLPIQLVPLLCAQCQTPVEADTDEVAWVCGQCGSGLLLNEEKGTIPMRVQFAAGIAPGQKGRPFWMLGAQVQLQRSTYGSSQEAESQRFWQPVRQFFIPAYSLPLEELIAMGMLLLNQPPNLAPGSPAPFLPVTVLPQDAHPLAEFVVLGIEAARKDKLKQVQMQLTLQGPPELWILP